MLSKCLFWPAKSEASRRNSVQGILTSSMARCHDYRHANHITKTIHSSKVYVFLLSTTNLEGRYLIFQLLYNTTSLFQILKVINIRNRSTVGLDLHDKFCRHILSARHNVDVPLYKLPVKSHQINYYTLAIYIKKIL